MELKAGNGCPHIFHQHINLMKSIIILYVGLLFGAQLFGQSREDIVLKNRPFQLSFVHPLGTNGIKAGSISNNVSFNALIGYQGGLKGVEFGGLFNVIRYDTYGAQFGGLGNIVAGTAHGAQFGGLLNISAAGMNAIQAAGLINVSTKSSRGAQFAGLVNVATGNMQGIQISGLINFARRLNGLQIGFLNLADTVERGIPIGFLSLVRRGYNKWEIGTSETLYGTASLKLGVSRFYNIFSIGFRPEEDNITWALGYGVGTQIPQGKRTSLSIDAIGYQIFEEDEFWDNNLNLLNRLSLSYNLHLSRHFTLYAGAAINVLVADNFNSNGEIRESIAPWAVFDRIYTDTRVQIYPGFQAGIRL